MSSTLIAHAGAELTTYAQLAGLPAPQALGRFHAPVAHARFVDAVREEVIRRGLTITKEAYALQRDGHSLFGVLDLAAANAAGLTLPQQGLALGLRNATNQQFGLHLVAGGRVVVCDNLLLSGDIVALARKNTTGIDLRAELQRGFDRFLLQAEQLTRQVEALAAWPLTTSEAKALIYDAFAARFLPSRLFDDVDTFYFRPTDETPDCQPRTAFGVHNAFTRAFKVLSPARQFEATQDLGRHFGLSQAAQLAPIIDVTAGARD
jgi:hypothetical protein